MSIPLRHQTIHNYFPYLALLCILPGFVYLGAVAVDSAAREPYVEEWYKSLELSASWKFALELTVVVGPTLAFALCCITIADEIMHHDLDELLDLLQERVSRLTLFVTICSFLMLMIFSTYLLFENFAP